MKKILIMAFYFGEKPQYYPMWEKSILNNATIDFILFTDIEDVKSKRNLQVIHISFNDIVELVQKKYEFKIGLTTPYKFADFRPAWGDIFSNYISGGYEFWGYSDLDMILGNIRKILNEEILDSYDKFYENGHFTLYRNNSVVNQIYKNSDCRYPEYDYKTAFSIEEQVYFDEYRGILPKAIRVLGNARIFGNYNIVFDPSPKNIELIYKGYPSIIKYNKGNCYLVHKDNNGFMTEKELLYFHCQKRRLVSKIVDEDCFFITQSEITPEIGEKEIYSILEGKAYKGNERLRYKLSYFSRKLLCNKYGIRGAIRRYKHSLDAEKYIKKLKS